MVKVYYEFTDHEYYALIAIKKESETDDTLSKAFESYLKHVGGDSLESVKNEGTPYVVSEAHAYVALSKSMMKENPNVINKEVLDAFYNDDAELILIDGSLV